MLFTEVVDLMSITVVCNRNKPDDGWAIEAGSQSTLPFQWPRAAGNFGQRPDKERRLPGWNDLDLRAGMWRPADRCPSLMTAQLGEFLIFALREIAALPVIAHRNRRGGQPHHSGRFAEDEAELWSQRELWFQEYLHSCSPAPREVVVL